ncbi:hypothetical protein A8709_13790 [Paenibacillus pectinilyticus]|uniref:Glycosyl hydrolase family 95 catalytic domain-containing protein n=1 Tax=Paenibacillus pectinilyticus TaxID=512399 RepID=A0A1C1A3N5_9BACL|nr:hypothetical protein [Paenibacillus pectinilyticus]OCT15171.1 hypothetical protein A8709_13790 [Paenibacillus pectinilyticus]
MYSLDQMNEFVEHKIREEEWDVRKAVFVSPSMNLPTNYMPDSPLLGNGDVGVTIGGNPEEQIFYMGKNDFWAQPSLGETEEQRRDRLLNEDGRRTGAHIMTVGQITLQIPKLAGAEYLQEQDILNAEVRGTFKKDGLTLRMRSWVCAEKNVLVTELFSDGYAIDLRVILHAGAKGEYEVYNYKNGSDEDLIWFKYAANSANLPETRRVAAVTRIVGGEEVRYKWCFDNAEAYCTVSPGTNVYVVTALTSNLDDLDYLEAAKETARLSDRDMIIQLQEVHKGWWSDYWKKSYVEINDPLLDKFYYASYYIIGSCTRSGKVQPGILGSWVTNDRPLYSGGYTMNYNYEAPYWGLYSGNRIAIAESYCDPLLDILPLGKWYAQQKLNCRGIYLPVQLGPWGMTCTTYFHGQKSNAAYGAVNLIMHFYHTYDLDYGRKIYPYLLETGNFWEDYLQFEEGRYVIYDDSIHELSNDRMNPILSLGFVRMIFKSLLELSQELGIDSDRHAKWHHILEHLSPYPVFQKNDKTLFRLTEEGMAWNNRGALAIQHIYPAGVLGLDSTPELLNIALDTLEELNRWSDYNAFTTYYPAAVRVGYNPRIILHHLRQACEEKSLPNLVIQHGGGGIEDASTVPNTIHEMFMQSHEGVLRLFPVWPKEEPAKFGRLRAVGAFLVSSEYKDGEVQYVIIESEKGRDCQIQNPWPGQAVSVYRNGILTEEHNGTRFNLNTKVNEKIMLVPANR